MADDNGQRRRGSDMPDKTDAEIRELIRHATTDGEKAQLLVLYQINKNLSAVAERQEEHTEEARKAREEAARFRETFDNHVIDERALFNKGIGAWKAVAIGSMFVTALFGVIGSLGAYIINVNLNDVRAAAARNSEQDTALRVLEVEVKALQESHARNTFLLDSALTNERQLGVVRPAANPPKKMGAK